MSEGTILHLQRLSTEDGPGIRTTVFFKGCPLRCAWCHNPESIALHPQVQWLENRCIACQACVQACPNHALMWTRQSPERDRTRCRSCGRCADTCPANAHELLGQKISAEKLVKELVKDRAYFEKSAGGVTLSGGEPTLQPDFALELLQSLRACGIATALDTCGLAQYETLERLASEADLILYDLKIMDGLAHSQFTGVENARILSNLLRLAGHLATQPGKRLWIRTPLIPGATDGPENVTAIGAYLVENLAEQVERWELCAFNNLCRDKYRRLGLEWIYADTPLLTRADLDRAGEVARQSGFDPQRIFVTGAVRVEN